MLKSPKSRGKPKPLPVRPREEQRKKIIILVRGLVRHYNSLDKPIKDISHPVKQQIERIEQEVKQLDLLKD
jgi:hypothetical protein